MKKTNLLARVYTDHKTEKCVFVRINGEHSYRPSKKSAMRIIACIKRGTADIIGTISDAAVVPMYTASSTRDDSNA